MTTARSVPWKMLAKLNVFEDQHYYQSQIDLSDIYLIYICGRDFQIKEHFPSLLVNIGFIKF